MNASAPPARVEVEAPYSALGHAQLATEMLTLSRDQELLVWALGGSSDARHPSHRPGYHPATRVVIDVSLLSRAPAGTTRRLLAAARSTGYWPMRACYEAAERLRPLPERQMRARLTLSPRGKVVAVGAIQSTPRDPVFGRCVLEHLRRLDLDVDLPRKLDLEMRVQEWRGDAPLPPRAPVTEHVPRWPSELLAALRQTSSGLAECYAAALENDPALWGRLAFRVELRDGEVKSAEQVETRFPSDALVECARRVLLGTRIPAAIAAFTFAARFGQPGAPPGAPPAAAPASEGAPAVPELAPPAPLPPVSH